MTVSISFAHNLIGPDVINTFYPSYLEIPKPGQWIYIESDIISIPRTLVKITDVSISTLIPDIYEVAISFSRISLKEDILFQRLLKQQINLIDEESEATEQTDFTDGHARTDTVSTSLLSGFFSGVFYSGQKYSGDG